MLSGEVEVLITSLLDNKKFNHKIFKELYFQRWIVETYYDELKNKLKIEYFSGYSEQAILQDFYAMIFVSNVQSIMVNEINDELANQQEDKKYQYKVNTNLSYGFLKDRIIALFWTEPDTDKIVNELKELFKKDTIPIRTNHSYKRNMKKYHGKCKPKMTQNIKEAS